MISIELLSAILSILATFEPSRRHLLLDWAVFSGEADFSSVAEVGKLACSDARFASAATFVNLVFHGNVSFRRTQFAGRLDLSGGWFRGPCTFRRADFLDEAVFEKRESSRMVIFEQATFVGPARFREARFWADVSFMMAQFRGTVDFRQTSFAADSRYRNARFEKGPPQCDNLARFNEGWWPGKNVALPDPASGQDRDLAHRNAETVAVHEGPRDLSVEPRREPKVFVSSSMSGLPVGRSFQLALEEQRDVRTIFWRQAFGPSVSNLENLEKIFASVDFAIFLFTPDDFRVKDGTSQTVPRDNIIFEVGMSVGRLGIARTFMLAPHDFAVSIPTDLAGLSLVTYSQNDVLSELEQAMGVAATKIRLAMQKIGLRPIR